MLIVNIAKRAAFHVFHSLHIAVFGWVVAAVFSQFGSAWGGTWNGPGNPDVDRPQNWLNNSLPAFNGTAVAIFGTGGDEARINVNVSFAGIVFNRDADFAITDGTGSLTLLSGGIQAGSPSATGRTYTISESSLVLGAAQTWSVTQNTSATTLAVSSVISGGGSALLSKAGAGTLILSAAAGSTYSGGTALNAGRLWVTNSSGSATGSGALVTAAGSVLAGSGIIAPGTGNNIEVAGTVTVGPPTGVGTPTALTLAPTSATVKLSSTSELRIDLIGGYNSGILNVGGATAGSLNDRLSFVGSCSSTVELAGTLALQLANTSAWAAGSSWRLFDWAGINKVGTFDSITGLPDLSGFNLKWDTSDLYAQGVLRVTVIPEPSRTFLLAIGLLFALQRRVRRRRSLQ